MLVKYPYPSGQALRTRRGPSTTASRTHPPATRGVLSPPETGRGAPPPYDVVPDNTYAMVRAETITQGRPLMPLVVFGAQGPGDTWATVTPRVVRFVGVTDAVLRRVSQSLYGHEPQAITWIMAKPRRYADLQEIFRGTRYELQASSGGSLVGDDRWQPQLFFPVVGLLRDEGDREGGTDGVDALARALKATSAVAITSEPTAWQPMRSFSAMLFGRS